MGGSRCVPSDPKLVLQEFEFVPKVRGYIELPGFYRMSEDGVYPTSVPFCPLWGNSVSRGQVKIQFLVVEMALCSIGVVRGVVQVVQNWFYGIRIRPESSRLG